MNTGIKVEAQQTLVLWGGAGRSSNELPLTTGKGILGQNSQVFYKKRSPKRAKFKLIPKEERSLRVFP